MSFAGFGAALGDLFTGMSQADKEREKVRRAQLMQDAQISDIGSQGRERDAMAAQRLAQAKRDEQLASPEFASHLTRAITDGNVDDIAWITQRRPELLSTLSRNPPTPKSLQSAEFMLGNKAVKGYYDGTVGGYFYNGVRVPNPGVIPPSSAGADNLAEYRKFEVAKDMLANANRNVPQPGKAFPAGYGSGKREINAKLLTPDQTALASSLHMPIPQASEKNPIAVMQNPQYAKALRDSSAYVNSPAYQNVQTMYQNAAMNAAGNNAGGAPQALPAAPPVLPAARPMPPVPQNNQQQQAQHLDKDPGFVALVNSLRGKPYADIVRAVTAAGYDVNTGRRKQ